MSRNKLRLNWTYALGEVLLIFIGISLAVAFDNGNQQRKRDKSQRLILEELRTDLYQDTVLISKAIASSENRISSIDWMTEKLEAKTPYNDSVSNHLSNILRFPRISFISAGYQTLKSSDITLVENQALRRELVEYYEYTHPYVVQLMEDVEFEFKTYWTPWILEHIAEFQYARKVIPMDYGTLINDPVLIRNFKINKDNNGGLYAGLLEAQGKMRQLIVNLELQLEKLD